MRREEKTEGEEETFLEALMGPELPVDESLMDVDVGINGKRYIPWYKRPRPQPNTCRTPENERDGSCTPVSSDDHPRPPGVTTRQRRDRGGRTDEQTVFVDWGLQSVVPLLTRVPVVWTAHVRDRLGRVPFRPVHPSHHDDCRRRQGPHQCPWSTYVLEDHVRLKRLGCHECHPSATLRGGTTRDG